MSPVPHNNNKTNWNRQEKELWELDTLASLAKQSLSSWYWSVTLHRHSRVYKAGVSDSLLVKEHILVCLGALFVWQWGCWNRLSIHTNWSVRWSRNLMVFPHEQMAWKGMKWNSETFILLYSLQSFSSLAYVTLCYLLPTHTLGNLLLLTAYNRIQDQIKLSFSLYFTFILCPWFNFVSGDTAPGILTTIINAVLWLLNLLLKCWASPKLWCF